MDEVVNDTVICLFAFVVCISESFVCVVFSFYLSAFVCGPYLISLGKSLSLSDYCMLIESLSL